MISARRIIISPVFPDFGCSPVHPDNPWLPPFEPPLGPGPVIPPRPAPNRFGQIRFLYAAVNQPPVTISMNGTPVIHSFRYSNITPYYPTPTGRNRIVVTNQWGQTLASINLPLSNNQFYTVALINADHGMELLALSDAPCNRRPGMACIRAINLSYNSSPANFFLSNMGLLFRQVGFHETTAYRQINPGRHTLFVTDFRTTFLPQGNPLSSGTFFPWVTEQINLQRNTTYTIYLIGNASGFPGMQIILAETDLD